MQNGLNEVHLRRLPKPPEVVLTAPAPGATYIYPEAVTLAANASDLDESIVRVEFHSGPNVLFSKAAAPFSGTHNNLLPGTHALTATAFDDGGLSTRSAPVTITVLPPIPASPTALHAVETEYAAVSLGWSDQGTNEGGFRVYRSPAGSTLAIAGEVGPNVTAFRDDTVTPSSTFIYRVAAFNITGEAASEPLGVQTPPPPPSAPANLTVRTLGFTIARLDWYDTSDNESHFMVERSADGITFTTVATLAANSVNYTDFDLLRGWQYHSAFER